MCDKITDRFPHFYNRTRIFSHSISFIRLVFCVHAKFVPITKLPISVCIFLAQSFANLQSAFGGRCWSLSAHGNASEKHTEIETESHLPCTEQFIILINALQCIDIWACLSFVRILVWHTWNKQNNTEKKVPKAETQNRLWFQFLDLCERARVLAQSISVAKFLVGNLLVAYYKYMCLLFLPFGRKPQSQSIYLSPLSLSSSPRLLSNRNIQNACYNRWKAMIFPPVHQFPNVHHFHNDITINQCADWFIPFDACIQKQMDS